MSRIPPATVAPAIRAIRAKLDRNQEGKMGILRRRHFAVGVLLLGATICPAQPNLAVPPSLTAEAIPPIPQSIMERANRYAEGRAAFLADWHPTRREILISTRFADVNQIHRVAMPGGARTQMTFYLEPVFGARYEPKRGDFFVFPKDTGGNEFYQLYRHDQETGEDTLLSDGKSRNGSPLFSRDGTSLAYTSTRRNGKDTDIYIADPHDPATTRLLMEVSGGGWFPAKWLPDGSALLIAEFKSVNESALYLVNAETRASERITPQDTVAMFQPLDFSPDGKTLYLVTDQGSEFLRLARMDVASRGITPMRPEINWNVEDGDLSEDGKLLAFTVNEDGSDVLHVMDLASNKDLPLPKLPYGLIGGLRWRPASHELGLVLNSARSPSDVYSINVNQPELERWTTSETGGLNAATFSEPRLVRWKSFDGRMISGYLYEPPKKFAGPRPVIVDIHGGPEGQARPGFVGRNNYFLNEVGVAILFPNVRGSTGYGKTFQNLDNVLKREDSVKDIGALLDWIAGEPALDASRVMVTGGSYGGYMTLASMVHYNDRFRCGLDVVGVSNFISFLERTEAYRRDLRRVEYGDERDPKIRAFFEEIAPLRRASRITRPMFIVQGKNDPRVPVFESRQMVEAIRKNGGPVWYLEAEDEGHGFAKKKNADFQFAATVMFIRDHLLK